MFWEVYALDRQEYLKSLTEQIRTKRARTMVAEEVEAHIEDQKQDFMAHGLGEEEAESMAVVEMGDPVEAGVKLDRVHRPKMEWTVLMAILVISIMGLILQAVVTSSFPTMNMSTLEAFKDNFLYGGIWSAMLIGIAVMLGICYLDYSILVKWSFPIWAVMQIPAVFSIVSKIFFDETMWIGPMVNGRSIVQMLLSYLVIPFYAGTIYHFRRKGSLERTVVFQDYGLFPWMTAGENILLALQQKYPKQPKKELKNRAIEMLKQVGLDESVYKKLPKELSGGMKQRCAIARSLGVDAPILLMDEPFGALDAVTRAKLQDLILQLWSKEEVKKTVFFVTHDVDEALLLANRIIVLGQSPSNVIYDCKIPDEKRATRENQFENIEVLKLRNELIKQINQDVMSHA